MSVFDNDIAWLRLADFGQPCTLQHRATRLQITAIVNDIDEPGNPIMGEPPIEEHSIEAAAADVQGVDTDWTVTVQATGITRPVSWVSPPKAGFIKIVMGDAQ